MCLGLTGNISQSKACCYYDYCCVVTIVIKALWCTRFHNIYGPYGTWKGGREKAPAAFCRKVLTSTKDIEMWGDGKQTRSFTYIDDCVEGILRITKSDFKEPLNLGSSEMVSMNGMMKTISDFESKDLPIR